MKWCAAKQQMVRTISPDDAHCGQWMMAADERKKKNHSILELQLGTPTY